MKYELFERTPVPRAVLRLGAPTVAGMALTVLYSMVDMILVGMAGDEDQLAVMALLSPAAVISAAIGSIFGMGGASCISRQLGAKLRRDASRTCCVCLFSAMLFAFASTAAGLFFLPFIVDFTGAAGNGTAELAENYGALLIWGTAPAALSFTMNQLIRAKGDAKEAMNGLALGAVVNLVADPLFILVLGMGVCGSAAASLAADLAVLLYYFPLIKRDDVLSVSIRDFRVSRQTVAQILAVGLPACLTHFLLSGCGLLFNRLVIPYGNHVVAAFSVASRILMLPVVISVGLAKGAQPLIGYNYASGNLGRMRGVIRFTCLLGTLLCLVLCIFMALRCGGLVHIFTDDPDVVWLSMVILNAMLIGVPVSTLEAVLLSSFQAMGNAGTLLFLTLSKQLLIYVPLLLLLEKELGLSGLILFDPLKEYLSILLAFLLYQHIIKRESRFISSRTAS